MTTPSVRLVFASIVAATTIVSQTVSSSEVDAPAGARAGRLESSAGFFAVGAKWIAAGEPAIEIRAQGVVVPDWSEWRRLTLQADYSDERPTSALIFFAPGTRRIEYRIAEDSAAVFSLKFVFIDPGQTSDEQLRAIRERRPSKRRDARAMPDFITRTAWGCPDGQATRGTPVITNVTHLLVHHSADNFTGDDYPAWVRAIWRFHVFTNGWSDFGYNWAIDPDGNLYEGRGGGDNVMGAHFSCVNTGTMGVVMLGTYTSALPTSAAMTTLHELLAWKAAQRGIDPLGKSLHRATNSTIDNISSHRDGNRLPNSCTVTECPGNALYPLLPQVRQAVADLLKGPQPALRADFDRGLTGWTASGLWRQWDGMAWYGDPETRTYDTGKVNAGELVSPVFRLDRDATLRFRSRHDTEDEWPFWDQKFVELSVDGGEWQLVDQLVAPSREWTNREYALKVRGNVRIRFRFDSVDDWKNRQEGWFLDDIQVIEP